MSPFLEFMTYAGTVVPLKWQYGPPDIAFQVQCSNEHLLGSHTKECPGPYQTFWLSSITLRIMMTANMGPPLNVVMPNTIKC